MGSYQLLFSVTVEHMYFTDHACKSLEFVPTHATAHLFRQSGLLSRISENRLSVFFEDDKLDTLQLYAQDDFAFSYKVFSRDSNFSKYTLPAIQPDDAILYFDNQSLNSDKDGRYLLHDGAYVSEADYVELNAPVVTDCFESRDYHVKPSFIVHIAIQKDSQLLSLDQGNRQLRQFFISFASNKTVWKYYFVGDLARRNLYIADLDNKIQFEEIGNAVLPGNRTAKMLQSTQAIQMLEQPQQRLQLKESLELRDKVLINRLPNASIHQINGEVINGKIESVSEVYVH
ncbi:MAG: hypothetical protein H6937_00295 [Burkholderiales bacterium]|nr:hypothetical protein [Burkholderiales bacterium]MDR4518434.1 hypothetical protein [Nitrosomonas sp.]